jgi:hypothetical protein
MLDGHTPYGVKTMNNGKVSESDQRAFKADVKIIRKALNDLRDDYSRNSVSEAQLTEMCTRLASQIERIEYWRTVLMVDERRIRSPVGLWDRWNRLRQSAEFIASVEAETLREIQ